MTVLSVRGSWSISALEMIDRHPANHHVLRHAFLTGHSLPCIFAAISGLANCFDTSQSPKFQCPPMYMEMTYDFLMTPLLLTTAIAMTTAIRIVAVLVIVRTNNTYAIVYGCPVIQKITSRK